MDIDRQALAVYRRNFPHAVHCRTIESLQVEFFTAQQADLWWLSPPCQPFTRRGRRRDLDDSRCAGLVNVVERIGQVRPRYVAMENVPEFAGSRAHGMLREMLGRHAYEVIETLLCPSELGAANRRRRFYLMAGWDELMPSRGFTVLGGDHGVVPGLPLAGFLDGHDNPALYVSNDFVHQFKSAMDVVCADDPAAITSCFTSAYGRSPVRTGSYLHMQDGRIRRFSPREILRLLSFGPAFSLPDDLPLQQAWPLVGNSLAIGPVRQVLSAVPEFSDLAADIVAPHRLRA